MLAVRILVAGLLALALTACGESPSTSDNDTEIAGSTLPAVRVDGPVLTRARAEARRARVSSADYTLSVTLDPALDHFAGTIAIAFELTQADQDLTVDFIGGMVDAVTVNGTAVEITYNEAFVTLSAAARAAHRRSG